MKQSFDKKQFEEFKKYFAIKNEAGEFDKKYTEKTIKYLNYIKWIPGILMIGIGNSISMNAGKKSSDIDLFIVSKQNYMWFVRIIITFVFQIIFVRKNKNHHAGRFCLSFFASEKGLNFGDFAIENDIYLYFWIVYFKPILDFDNTYELFLKQNSKWADFKDYKILIEKNKKYINYTGKGSKNSKIIIFINNILKKIFLKKTILSFEKLGKPFGVIINDNLLKFHDKDVRKEISITLFK